MAQNAFARAQKPVALVSVSVFAAALPRAAQEGGLRRSTA
jgi:hypothetical protein